MQNRPVLVLGASGRIGQMLRVCWPAPQDLVLHSRQAMPEFIHFDLILEPEKAVAAMAAVRAVICLSGVTPHAADRGGDVYSCNTALGVGTVRAAHAAGVARVFLASTAAVYGTATGIQRERDPCFPVSDYGRSKLAMEQAARATADALGQPLTILRIGNVAGADAILGGWHDQMALDVLGDGQTPQRSYIGPKSLARILNTLTRQQSLPETLNVAAPGPIGMGALLDAAGLTWAPRIPDADVIARVELCTKQLENHVSFAPEDSMPATMVAEWRAYRALLQRQ